MLARLVSNPWPQVICLLRPPTVLGLQAEPPRLTPSKFFFVHECVGVGASTPNLFSAYSQSHPLQTHVILACFFAFSPVFSFSSFSFFSSCHLFHPVISKLILEYGVVSDVALPASLHLSPLTYHTAAAFMFLPT